MFSVLDGGLAHVAAAEHLGNLRDALFRRELAHATGSALAGLLLLHLIVNRAEGCNLWQMGDADHLTLVISHLLHDLCHLLGNLTTDTRIDLVEDDGGQFDGPADHGLQRQHHTGYLTT